MKYNKLKLKNENRNELYSKLYIEGRHIWYADGTSHFRLTSTKFKPYAEGSLKYAGAAEFKIFFIDTSGITPKAAVKTIGTRKNLIDLFDNVADEEIELPTIEEKNEAPIEDNEAETSFPTPAVRKRTLNYKSTEPTIADRQRIYEALKDIDIVEFVQEPTSAIDIQLRNASKHKFKLKEAEANLRSAEEHEDLENIRGAKKEIYSIELHLKSISLKLARLYADKFNDSNLTWPTRIRYLFKLKGFKIGVIVSAIGITISAIVAGIIDALSPTTEAVVKAGNAVGKVIKKAVETIEPVVTNLFEKARALVWKIVLWAIGIFANIVKGIFGYFAEHVIILLAVVLLVILQVISKNRI